jgi:glycogen debranching enzyme
VNGQALPCPRPAAPGLTLVPDGAVLAVETRHATAIDVCLFDDGDEEVARFRLPCREGDLHFGIVPGLTAGRRYGLRVHGPYAPEHGHRFDSAKLLVDPMATRLDRPFVWSPALAAFGIDTAARMPKAIVEELPPPVAPHDAPAFLIYELGVRGFTMLHPDVPEHLRGTVAALAHPAVLAHLQRLGVSHVELLPIAAWIDERHLPPLGLTNAWGYNPVAFLAPDPRLAPGGQREVAETVSALAAAGIGVILDVVYNHSGESDAEGPTLSLRGLDSALYYRHTAEDPGRLVNDTACGNTLACDRPAVAHLVLAALRHWRRLGVAGFRFDLATTLGRDAAGYSHDAALLAAIARDPALAGCLLIAEPWDMGPGGYRLGGFPAPYGEWNGAFRDDIRRFWRGDAGTAGALARGLAGSADLFRPSHRSPSASVNYVTSHDGFTLADLVAHERKDTRANGEDGRDGTDENFSWNNGHEGPSDDVAIVGRRRQDIAALLATVLLARGTPMVTAGDEGGRTQHGNNNAYPQDNAAFWLNWETLDEGVVAHAARLAALRRAIPALREDRHLTGEPHGPDGSADVLWTRPDGAPMRPDDWHVADAFVMTLCDRDGHRAAIAINRGRDAMPLSLPPLPSGLRWSDDRIAGTSAEVLAARSVGLFEAVMVRA